jgi:hypothetical protein
MGIATIHYLSINARDGRPGPVPSPNVQAIEYTYSVDSLQADTEYSVFWGDGDDELVTTDSDGTLEATHTYANPDSYNIQVKSGSKVVAKFTAVVTADDGVVSSEDSPFFEGVEATFDFTSFAPDTDLYVVWGDGSANGVLTTDSSGEGSLTHTYPEERAYVIQVFLDSNDELVASLSLNAGFLDGDITTTGDITEGVSQSFDISGLVPAGQYTIDWGDGDDELVTMDSSGEATVTHTYAAADDYTIDVSRAGHISASIDITVVEPPA